MREEIGNLWDRHKEGNWIVISTNGVVKNNGQNVMGRGVALQAAQRFPNLPKDLGERINEKGNHVFAFSEYQIITMPVKHKWWEKADIELIERSAEELDALRNDMIVSGDINLPIYLVRAGCGNGQLQWSEVKSVLEKYLDDDFVVMDTERILSKEEMMNSTLTNIWRSGF